jgi:uncharacterized protein YgiB involved in biofilm formation
VRQKDRPIKRPTSRRLASVSLLGLSAFGLAACQEERIDARTFTSEEACVAGAGGPGASFTVDDCRTAFLAAREEHLASAPRYDAMAVCESQHGEDMCVEEPGGGGSIIVPIMMGYMMGQMLSQNAAQATAGKALYPVAAGGFTTADGRTQVGTVGATARVAPAALTKAAPTIGKPPMTQATVAQRGGFGASSTAARVVGVSSGG